jgi:hypothetical protein
MRHWTIIISVGICVAALGLLSAASVALAQSGTPPPVPDPNPYDWFQFTYERDMGAGVLALVGTILLVIVVATPRRWRALVLGGIALYALVTSVMVGFGPPPA